MYLVVIVVISANYIFAKSSRSQFNEIFADSIFLGGIYIHVKLASGSAESLQNLRSREMTWLRLTCEIRASEAIRGPHVPAGDE